MCLPSLVCAAGDRPAAGDGAPACGRVVRRDENQLRGARQPGRGQKRRTVARYFLPGAFHAARECRCRPFCASTYRRGNWLRRLRNWERPGNGPNSCFPRPPIVFIAAIRGKQSNWPVSATFRGADAATAAVRLTPEFGEVGSVSRPTERAHGSSFEPLLTAGGHCPTERWSRL